MNPARPASTQSRMDTEESVLDMARTRGFVSDIKERWRASGQPDARSCLDQYPRLRGCKSFVLDLAYEEYCVRLDAGEPIEAEEFCNRFPSIGRSLFRQIEVHEYLQNNPDLLDRRDLVPWPDPGEVLFDFTVLEELGRGALARVYLCSQSALGDRQVVLKIAYDGAYEAETLGRLSHPNIVPVYSVEKDDASAVSGICMPFRGRSTLRDALDAAFEGGHCPSQAEVILRAAERSRLATDQYDRIEPANRLLQSAAYADGVVSLATQLADALQHAHEKGILHGDLKPSNVLITPGGTPMLVDFNLSLDCQTQSGARGGTLPYMSPEQIQWVSLTSGEHCDPPNERSDIFSLGVILYELLCGQLPYGQIATDQPARQIAEDILHRQRAGAIPLRDVNPGVDRRIADCVERCLSFEPSARPASMRELADSLRKHLTLRSRARRWIASHRRFVLTATLLALFAVGAGAAFLIGREPYSARQLHWGIKHYQAKKYEQAIACFDRAIKEEPNFAEAFYQRGRAHLRHGKLPAARQDLSDASALRTDGKDSAALGYCSSLRKDHPRARAYYETAIRLGYESVSVFNNFGFCYENSGDYVRAKEALDRAIELNDRSYVPYVNLALLDLHKAQQDLTHIPSAGLADAERAIELAPRNAKLYHIAACLCGHLAKNDPAMIERGLKYLNLACDEGTDPRKLNFRDTPAFAPFRDHREFERICRRPPPKKKPAKLPRLLDPIDENPEHLPR